MLHNGDYDSADSRTRLLSVNSLMKSGAIRPSELQRDTHRGIRSHKGSGRKGEVEMDDNNDAASLRFWSLVLLGGGAVALAIQLGIYEVVTGTSCSGNVCYETHYYFPLLLVASTLAMFGGFLGLLIYLIWWPLHRATVARQLPIRRSAAERIVQLLRKGTPLHSIGDKLLSESFDSRIALPLLETGWAMDSRCPNCGRGYMRFSSSDLLELSTWRFCPNCGDQRELANASSGTEIPVTRVAPPSRVEPEGRE